MLHVLLLILKITGIVIACILGLVILAVAAVLFVPVRYKVDADYHGKLKAHAKLSWLGIIRGQASYDNGAVLRLKALFITIYSNDKNKKASGYKNARKKKRKRTEENVFSTGNEKAVKPEYEEKPQIKMAEAVGDKKSGAKSSTKSSTEPDNKKDRSGKADDVSKTKENENIRKPAKPSGRRISGKKSIVSGIKRFFTKVKDKCIVVYTKLKELIKLLIDTLKKLPGAADKLKDKVDSAKEFVTDEDNKALFHFLMEQLKALIKLVRPKKYRINVRAGLEEPADMGAVLAFVSVLYGIIGVELSLEPVFDEDVFEGSMLLKGRVRMFPVLLIALKVYRNEQFKKFISR